MYDRLADSLIKTALLLKERREIVPREPLQAKQYETKIRHLEKLLESERRTSGGYLKTIAELENALREQLKSRTLKNLLKDTIKTHKGAIAASLALGGLGGLGSYLYARNRK